MFYVFLCTFLVSVVQKKDLHFAKQKAFNFFEIKIKKDSFLILIFTVKQVAWLLKHSSWCCLKFPHRFVFKETNIFRSNFAQIFFIFIRCKENFSLFLEIWFKILLNLELFCFQALSIIFFLKYWNHTG